MVGRKEGKESQQLQNNFNKERFLVSVSLAEHKHGNARHMHNFTGAIAT